MNKVIFWDFDGTLVTMPGLYRAAIMDVLNECEPGHCIDPEQIRPYLRSGFPWHTPGEPHLQLVDPELWWLNLECVFIRAYEGVGFDAGHAQKLAKQVRKHVIDPRRYVLYDDALPVLEGLRAQGWRHIILSNHVPELPDIVEGLGLAPYLDCCITSAFTGYEKPHPEAFRIALARAGNPEKAWMIGDNILADIQGAEALGIPAILVHSSKSNSVKYCVPNLAETVKIIEEKEERQ
jgi:putative hydrolase of the HAD superfamily